MNSSLDKIGGGLALEQNRSRVETWGYDDSNFYPKHTLIEFRQAMYRLVFRKRRHPLFDTLDALLAGGTFASFASLSQSERFQRKWLSLYAAVEDGQRDAQALRNQLACGHRSLSPNHLNGLPPPLANRT